MISKPISVATLFVATSLSWPALTTAQTSPTVRSSIVPVPALASPSGGMELTWDGEYADLLATDAMAVCWSTLAGKSQRGGFDSNVFTQTLWSKMVSASACAQPVSAANAEDADIKRWISARKLSACNADPETGKAMGIDLLAGVSRSTGAYVLPTVSQLAQEGLVASAGAVVTAQSTAVDSAEMALCVAYRLRDQLESAEMTFAPAVQVRRVQGFIYERALHAVNTYSALLRVFAAPAQPSFQAQDPFYFLPVLWYWRSFLSRNGQLGNIGEDFGRAVRLLIESTETLAETFLREPSSQAQFGTLSEGGLPAMASVGKLAGGRARLLSLLYGQSLPNAMPLQRMSSGARRALALARRLVEIPLRLGSAPVDLAVSAKALAAAIEAKLREQCAGRAAADTACSPTTSSTPYEQYLLWIDHQVSQDDMVVLTSALYEVAVGFPTSRDGTTWTWNLTPSYVVRNAFTRSSFHVLGEHRIAADDTTLFLSSNFAVAPLSAAEMQARHSTYPYKNLVRVPDLRTHYFDNFFQLDGTIPTLVAAREALALAGEVSDLSAATAGAGDLPQLLEAVLGARTAIVRRAYSVVASGSGGTMQYSPVVANGSPQMSVEILTRAGDPITHVSHGVAAGPVHTLARSPDSRTFVGGRRADIVAMAAAPLVSSSSGVGLVRRSVQFAVNPSGEESLLLRSNAVNQEPSFEPLHTYDGPLAGGTPTYATTTFGGRLNALVDRAFQMSSDDWSIPSSDAFGLPLDWAPAGDASLSGGVAGQPVHEYLLGLAERAASEASVALEHAFDGLAQEAADQTALAAAEERGSELPRLEQTALCGRGKCELETVYLMPAAAACLPGTGGGFKTLCDLLAQALDAQLPKGGFALAKPVYDAGYSIQPVPTPTFSAYTGGSLQSLLVDQWAAWRGLVNARSTALLSAGAIAESVRVADEEWASAQADFQATEAELVHFWNVTQAQSAEAHAQASNYSSAALQLSVQEGYAKEQARNACSTTAYTTAITQAHSISDGLPSCSVTANSDGTVQTTCLSYANTPLPSRKTFSLGPILAATQRCKEMETAAGFRYAELAPLRQTMVAQGSAAQKLAQALGGMADTVYPRFQAALARKGAAEKRKNAAYLSALVTAGEKLNSVVEAQAKLERSAAGIAAAFGRLESSLDRLALQLNEDASAITSRFGVRRRYRSYEMWRGRALTENARRLAVAARRAVEGRYAVQLSDLKAPEAFVDSPATWADEIYGDDLQPFSVGEQRTSDASAGMSAFKVLDYVRNLQRFVNGYTVGRPSVRVDEDSEIVQFGGPLFTVMLADGRQMLDSQTVGWEFWCPETESYVTPTHVVTEDQQLASVCGGQRPTKARLSFALDPWGRVEGTAATPGLKERYNGRWKRLAVNLVGTGIRDCSRAGQGSACYAEPFVRYSLQHRGPAQVTSFDQVRRDLRIPVGTIERGKALVTEQWLDPVSKGWGLANVQAVARDELAGRPLGGLYELVIELSPDIRLAGIERVQILTAQEYWVRQKK